MAAFLPKDEVLPDTAVVVKGGILPSADLLQEAAKDYFRETERQSGEGIYGVSVCSLPSRTAEEILRAIPESKRLPNPKIRQTTAEKLRHMGYDVCPSGWTGHATLRFPDLPTEQDWKKLQEVFMDAECNPVPRSKPQ